MGSPGALGAPGAVWRLTGSSLWWEAVITQSEFELKLEIIHPLFADLNLNEVK